MKSIWTTNYENNAIKVENTWFHGERLFINDKLKDENQGMFSSTLKCKITNSNNEQEGVKVRLGGFFKVKCTLFVDGKELELNQIK